MRKGKLERDQYRRSEPVAPTNPDTTRCQKAELPQTSAYRYEPPLRIHIGMNWTVAMKLMAMKWSVQVEKHTTGEVDICKRGSCPDLLLASEEQIQRRGKLVHMKAMEKEGL